MNKKSLLIAVLLLLAGAAGAYAQLVSCNAFLQGNYIEVGVNTLGSYGSSTPAPSGYHPRGGAGVYNTCTNTTSASNTNLGFVADPDKDGWTVGSPAYMGDYFLPGSPYEGWMISVNGSQISQNNGATSTLGGITSVTNAGKIRSANWQGSYSGLAITQLTSFDTANLFFTCKVTLKNTTGSTIPNIYYLRGVDPDNEEPLTSNFSTNNNVAYQLPNSLGATLVTATGQLYGAYLGLGTLDPRAKGYLLTGWPPSATLPTIYAQTASGGYTYAGSTSCDCAIGIVFNIGSIAPGDSTSFVFTYILRGSDFLTALLSTSSNWTATGDADFAHKSGDTAKVCQSSSTTLNIYSTNSYSYTWTSLTGETLSSTTGSTVSVATGTTLIRIMVVGTATGLANDTTYINVNPEFAVPAAPTSAGSNSPICQGSALNLTASGAGSGLTYQWAGPGLFSSTVQNPTITNAQPAAAGVYSVYAVNNGCPSATAATTTVAVNALPTIALASSAGTSICNGSSTTLTASGASTYSWSGARLSATTGASVVASPTVGTTYSVVGTDTHGCTASASLFIGMSSNISAISGASSVCANSSTTLTDGSSPGTWTSSNTAVATVNAVNGVVTGVAAGTVTISYTATSYCGTATKAMTVTAAPSVAAITGNTNIFAGSTTTLSTTTTGGTWASGNTSAATINSAGVVSGVAAGFATISYNVTSGGCTGRATTDVTVNNCGPNAILNFSYTGAPQTWTVPDGVTSVSVTVTGAAGGAAYYDASYGNHAGKGGKVVANLAVTPGQVLSVNVGGMGGAFVNTSVRSTGGYNGGGNGGEYYAGGGGGASDIRVGGTGLANRVVVAGGGGADGYGYNGAGNGGDGGNTTGGTGGFYPSYTGGGGAGGSQTAGGAGGIYPFGSGPTYVNYYGNDGSAGNGGDGSFYYGGGGGGGYYGGGGGGYLGDGGGGSSYADATLTSSVAMTSGFNAGAGSVQITFPYSNVVITAQPADVTVCEGASATFSVAASMAPTPNTLSYQWQVNSGSGFTDIAGATSTTLTLTTTGALSGNQYRSVVSGTCSQVTNSNAATLTVNTAPTITCSGDVAQGNDAGQCSGAVTYSAATVTGTSPTISYSAASGSSFAVGVTTVTATATNSCGTANCSFNVTVSDNEAPHAICQNYTMNLSGGAGTLTTANIDNGSYDNCGIASLSLSKTSFSCSDVGDNTVTLTATDVHGNTASCTATVTVQYQPSCSIAVTPSTSTYTGGIPNNIYLGYGPQSATLTVSASGGSGFTYSWSPSTYLSSTTAAAPVFSPTAAGHYTYTVTVTNSNGCSTTCTVEMCVVDAVDHGHSNKVILCHIPPGNPGNPQQLSISTSAVPAHLSGHAGDHLGPCYGGCGIGARGSEPVALASTTDGVQIYPNPSEGTFAVVIPAGQNDAVVQVTDVTGKEVISRAISNNTGKPVQFDLSGAAAGIYLVKVNAGDYSTVVKLVVK